MKQFDGRNLAVGIVGGVVLGLIVMFLTSNPNWVYICGMLGGVLGISVGPFGKDDANPPGS